MSVSKACRLDAFDPGNALALPSRPGAVPESYRQERDNSLNPVRDDGETDLTLSQEASESACQA